MNTTNSTRNTASNTLLASFKKTALNRGLAAALCAIGTFAATAAHAAPVNVAILNGSSGSMTMSSVASQLNDDSYFDFTASVLQGSAINNLTDLSAYNVVLLGGSGYSNAEYSANTLSAVKAFMQAGGGVVTAGWYRFGVISAADQPSADAISPVVTGRTYDFAASDTVVMNNTSHAITTGVGNISVSGCCIEVASALDVGATSLANAAGKTAVAYQDTVGRSVYLGLLYSAAQGYNNTGLRSGDGDRLLEQSVNWAAQRGSLFRTVNATVPEPGSLALVMTAVAGLALARRRG